MSKQITIFPESKCSRCKPSSCCTYITQPIKKPRDQDDYMNLLWQVSHEHVSAFKDRDGWYLMIDGKCEHLQPDGRCGIYESRPDACREHSDESCEFDRVLSTDFKLFFPTYESLLAHCKKKFKDWGEESAKSKKKAKLKT